MIGPALWSITTLQAPITGVMPTPGPVGGFGRFAGTGGPPGGLPFTPDEPGQVDNPLLAYLMANQGSAKYLVATTGSMSAAPLIIATGKPILPMGGFSGGDPAPTAAQLERMVRTGELRFVLAGGPGRPGSPGGFVSPGGPGGPGDAGSRGGGRTEWVQEHCGIVDPAAYAGAVESTDPRAPRVAAGPTDPTAPRRGVQQLYDCASSGPTTS
jgi:hypothetical protein